MHTEKQLIEEIEILERRIKGLKMQAKLKPKPIADIYWEMIEKGEQTLRGFYEKLDDFNRDYLA